MRTASMYQRAMGASFDRLPLAVRRFHQLAGSQELHGWVDIEAPSSVAASLLAARLCFDLREAGGKLEMHLSGLRFLGVPCPRWLLPRLIAEESGDGDRLHFRVRASLPLIGTVTSYHGHLTVAESEPA
ncbi:hypothetical protein SRS16CHR_01405 [Variovorax sp. SRS16]|uniref:DUF4166 domain-containing protein n=1 Tax=Variovorax sp. SRS16 TaxID=282217 RepID=UPI001315FECF|nr:DUF4166 domain-containing protein [Variovorax sp. SRS16]VTU15209.1 hypothetical protein SRS16CHR_01405 [Variovorax sp. SRS16]